MTPDLTDQLGPVGSAANCPGCGSEYAIWVTAGTQDNLLCLTCGRCWHQSPGQPPARVQMRDCAGCEYQSVCLAAQD